MHKLIPCSGTPLVYLGFKKALLKLTEEFRFGTNCPRLFIWCLRVDTALSFTTAWCHCIGEQIQFWLCNVIVCNFGRGLPLGCKEQQTTFQRILILINYSEWIKFSLKFLNLKIPYTRQLLPIFSPPLFLFFSIFFSLWVRELF